MSTTYNAGTSFRDSQERPTQAIAIPVAAVLLTLVVGWAFVHRPARMQIAGLERQCQELAKAVDRLAGQSGAIDRSTKLLQLVNDQAAMVESAELSLATLDRFHSELAERVDHLQHLRGTLTDLTEIEQALLADRESLAQLTRSLRGLSDTNRQVVAEGTVIADVRQSLNVLDDLHVDLEDQRYNAISAAVALDELRQVCDGLLTAQDKVEAAAAVAERWGVAQQALVGQADKLNTAEIAVQKLAAINSQLNDQGPDLTRASRNLERMAAINQRLVAESDTLNASLDALQKLTTLDQVVGQAALTIDVIQRMVVDIYLMQPANVQEAASLATANRKQPADLASTPIKPQPQHAESWALVYQAVKTVTTGWGLH